jgi:hypothetical protein
MNLSDFDFLSDKDVDENKLFKFVTYSSFLGADIDSKREFGYKESWPYFGKTLHIINYSLFWDSKVWTKPNINSIQNEE